MTDSQFGYGAGLTAECLIMATSLVMSRAADHDWRAYVLTGVCTAIFVFTKINPLIVVAAAGVIGYFEVV